MAKPLETDPIKTVNGDAVVVGNTLPRHPGGRPRKLTVECFLRICALVQQGLTNTQACKVENINYSGFRMHVRSKPWWAKRFQHADQIRDEYLRDFHLSNITKHAKESWAASAWILERRWPKHFALHYTQHRTTEATEQSVGEAIPAERLARYGELMLQMAAEDRVQEAAKVVTLPESSDIIS
jgi:hypothetical protein